MVWVCVCVCVCVCVWVCVDHCSLAPEWCVWCVLATYPGGLPTVPGLSRHDMCVHVGMCVCVYMCVVFVPREGTYQGTTDAHTDYAC